MVIVTLFGLKAAGVYWRSSCYIAYRQALNLGYCPHPVTVYIRGPIKGYI